MNLSELRNAYHHHGMRPLPLVDDTQAEDTFRRIRAFWNGTLRSRPDIPLSLGESAGGRVLVSPIGKRPGVLFSAIERGAGFDAGRPRARDPAVGESSFAGVGQRH